MRAVLPGTRVAEVSDAKLPEVMAVAEIVRLAVTVQLIAGSEPIVTLLEMDAVTEPIWAVPAPRVIVPSTTSTAIPPAPANYSRLLYPPPIKADMLPTFAVTVPEMVGREPMVTLFDMDAVTEPIWAVPSAITLLVRRYPLPISVSNED